MPYRVLVVDDELVLRRSLAKALEDVGYTVVEAADASEGLRLVGEEMPDLVLLDWRLPDRDGVSVLREMRKTAPDVPVVMITAHASVGGAVDALKSGAYDYLAKPFEIEDMLQTAARALEARQLREQIRWRHTAERQESALEGVVSKSPAMREVVRLVTKLAASEATTILLLGESGVGKGLVARALHFQSAFWDKPFTNITCTALAETLLESELFGHEKGAFTDARVQKKGLFELAHGGTIFLDEIGDLSPALQGKLLRVLEDKSFRRVGGTRDIHVAVRIVAATNKDLEGEVQAGRFRRDLYYRLRVVPITIPPLRERRDDILPLAESFVQHFDREFRKSVKGFAPGVGELLLAYPWPGNVRELRNAIERAVLLGDDEWLGAADLPAEIHRPRAVPAGPVSGDLQLPAGGVVLADLERELVRQALARCHGSRTGAARLLGLNRDQIRYRIEKFRLREQFPEGP